MTLNQMKTVRYSNKQLLICGNIWEVRTYPNQVRIDPLPQSKPSFRGRADHVKKEYRAERSLYRSRRGLQGLINANIGFHLKPNGKPYNPLFITFTFRENVQDVNRANGVFTNFIPRLNYAIFSTKKSVLKYVVGIEFQKRGAIHYHAVFFNIPYVVGLKDLVAEIWGEGFVKVESLKKKKKNVNDIGFYLTKYMTKEQFDSRLVGKKCYFSSRNLFRPVPVKEEQKVEILMSFVKPEQKFFEKSVPATEYSQKHLLQKYNLNNPSFVRAALDLIAKGRYLNF